MNGKDKPYMGEHLSDRARLQFLERQVKNVNGLNEVLFAANRRLRYQLSVWQGVSILLLFCCIAMLVGIKR